MVQGACSVRNCVRSNEGAARPIAWLLKRDLRESIRPELMCRETDHLLEMISLECVWTDWSDRKGAPMNPWEVSPCLKSKRIESSFFYLNWYYRFKREEKMKLNIFSSIEY